MMINFQSYHDECRREIESALHQALPPVQTPPAALHEAMRYSVLSGGKRIRPLLTLATAECLGRPRADALCPAIAVELLHTYTLIHDDLPCMDNDDFRRGRPTCHKMFGEAGALLAGDALLTLAFETAAAAPVGAAQIVQTLAAAAGSRGVIGGQSADLNTANATADPDSILFIHEHKTADLFRAAVETGALAVGADPQVIRTLGVFGRAFGLAFQVVDDILDATQPDDHGFSCVQSMGMSWATDRAAALTRLAIGALEGFGDAAAPLCAFTENMLKRTS